MMYIPQKLAVVFTCTAPTCLLFGVCDKHPVNTILQLNLDFRLCTQDMVFPLSLDSRKYQDRRTRF